MNDPAASLPSGTRRQFLMAGSAVAVGAMVVGKDLFSGPNGLERLASGKGPRIPVAFVEGSGGATSLADALAGTARRAVPAVGLRATESLVGRPARMSILGFAAGRGTGHSGHATVLLDALVPSPSSRGQTIPFYAFTFRRIPSVTQSAPSRMNVVAGDALRVGLQLQTTGATGASATTVFTSGPSSSLPTFQPGIYLLGLEQGMWSRTTGLPAVDDPAWASMPSLVVRVGAEAAG